MYFTFVSRPVEGISHGVEVDAPEYRPLSEQALEARQTDIELAHQLPQGGTVLILRDYPLLVGIAQPVMESPAPRLSDAGDAGAPAVRPRCRHAGEPS